MRGPLILLLGLLAVFLAAFETRVRQNNKVIGKHSTNVFVPLENLKSLLAWFHYYVVVTLFFTSLMFYWLNELNELVNDTKVQHVTSIKKKPQKSGNSRPNDASIKKKPQKSGNSRPNDDTEKCELNNQLNPGCKIGKLLVSGKKIGEGCNGTIVLEGNFHGRPVAVKRILKVHYDVASKEIQNLRKSDQHPNIVRWYGDEHDKDFVYVVLERCICSLHELILPHTNSSVRLQLKIGVLKDFKLKKPNGQPSPELLKVMRDTITGLAHLHELGILHGNLKPQNVLIQKDSSFSAKVSDMGISKRLPADMSSLINATCNGSLGWQVPEQFGKEPQTCAVDLFSFGCLLFFCITGGKHPFGVVRKRDANIEEKEKNLSLMAEIPEAFHLISCLLDPNPKLRPTAAEVLNHPLFWDPDMRLSFLRETSDFIESKDSKINPKLLKALENIGKTVILAPVCKWNQQLDETFLDQMSHVRKYNYNSVRDLLRLIRNALNHYRQLKKQHQDVLGPLPTGFESYFSSRFPKLLIEVYKVLQVDCGQEKILHKYYRQGPL